MAFTNPYLQRVYDDLAKLNPEQNSCRLLRKSSRAWSPLWLPTPSMRRPA